MADRYAEDETVSAEGHAILNDEAVDIADVAEVGNGKVTVKLTDGRTVDATALDFEDSGEAELWRVVGKYAADAESARALLEEYRGGDLDAYKYARGVEEAFLYGKLNISPREMAQQGSYVNMMSPTQKNMAYKQGRIAGQKQEQQQKAEGNRQKAEGDQQNSGRKRKGAVHYGYEGDTLDESKLRPAQRVGVDFAKRMAKKKGNTFYFFRSFMQNGVRVYKNAEGKVVPAKKNGWYNPEDGSIHIDLNCGDMGSTVLFTIAHELTHWMKDTSLARYRELCGIITEGFLERGQSVEKLVKNKMEEYREAGEILTWEEAYDEVIASSMEGVLKDGRVMDLLDAAETKSLPLWEQLKSFLEEIAALIRDTIQAYRNVEPESAEGRMVLRMKDLQEQIQNVFAAGLHEGGEYFREGGKINTAQEGGLKYSLNKNAKSELHKALYDKSYRDDVLLRDETPKIMLAQKGVKNHPMAMKASHIRENVFTREEAANLGLKIDGNINYHGLGESFFLQVIDGLDNVKEAYRGTKNADNVARRENYFLLISEFSDKEGNIINVPVYVDEHVQINRVFIDVNKISTVFGKENLQDYIAREIRKGNIVRIKNRSNPTSERSAPIAEGYSGNASISSIRNPEQKVNKNSLRYQKNAQAQAHMAEADSMETMLTDGTIVEKLSMLQAKEKGLVAKIKAFLKDFVKRLKEAYQLISPQTTEGRIVADMVDAAQELQDLFADALLDAGENFQTAEKNTTGEGGVRYMSRGESLRIKEQIAAASVELNNMDIVVSVVNDGFTGMRDSDIARKLDAEFSKFGNRIDRQNFGVILLEYQQINKALNYLKTPGEKAALLTVPRVLKRGIQIDTHTKHKERGVDSYTFAAPVEINGKRGNVGVVVQRVTGTNRFKTLRVLLPNGKAFEFVKNNEADSTSGSSSKQQGLEGIPIESASKISIRNSEGNVKENDLTEKRNSSRSGNMSDRAMLVDLFEQTVTDSNEYKALQNYKKNIDRMMAMEEHLERLSEEIKRLSFAEGPRDMELLNNLKLQQKKAVEELNRYDNQLLQLEKSGVLRAMVERNRKLITQQSMDKAREYYRQKNESRETEKIYI